MKKYLICYSLIFVCILSYAQSFTHFEYKGGNKKIVAAVEKANKVISNPNFYKSIDSIISFDFTTYTGRQVVNEYKAFNSPIIVNTYWAPYPFSKANARTQNLLEMNTAKLHRSIESIAITLIHESIHYVDYHTNNQFDYTHNGNKEDGNENSAPYKIENIIQYYL